MYKMFYNVHILCFFLEVKKWVGHPLQVTTNEWFRRHRRSSSRADWLVPAGLRDMKRIFKGMQWANCLIAFIACLQLVVFAHVHNFEVPRRWSSQEGTPESWFSEPRFSEFRDIVNKIQLPFWGFTRHITFI